MSKRKNKRQKKAAIRQKKAKQSRHQEAKRKREAEVKRASEEGTRKPRAKAKSKPKPLASQPQPLANKPQPPIDPHLAALNKRFEEFQAEKDYEGRIALFLKTMDEGLLDEENAYEMLNEINQQGIIEYGNEQRDRLKSLVALLRERLPEAYEHDAPYYLEWLVRNAFASNRLEDLPELADQVAAIAGQDLDTFYNIVHHFAYHEQLTLIVRMMRKGYPHLQEESERYFYGVDTEFASTAMKYELFAYVEEHPTGDATDPALRERITTYYQDVIHWDSIDHSISDISGRMATPWTLADFGLEEDLSGDDYDPEDHDMSRNLLHFTMQFLHYVRDSERISYAKGEQAREMIHQYLLQRQAGELKPTENMFEGMRRSKRKRKKPNVRKPDHFLVPDRQTLDLYLSSLMNFINPQVYSMASMYELQPAWLRYLESQNLIDATLRDKAFNELRGMKGDVLKVLDSYTSDSTLLQGTQNWG